MSEELTERRVKWFAEATVLAQHDNHESAFRRTEECYAALGRLAVVREQLLRLTAEVTALLEKMPSGVDSPLMTFGEVAARLLHACSYWNDLAPYMLVVEEGHAHLAALIKSKAAEKNQTSGLSGSNAP